jgi:hypothetical protein
MRTPVLALLWENWRLTRLEAVQRVAQGIVLPGAVLAWFAAFGRIDDGAARFALYLLAFNYAPLWLSVAKLNGGRFMDSYRPGYPFYFLYTRPVRTFVLVGVPLAYLTLSAVATYIVSALVLRATFGYPFPLPLAAWFAAYHVAQWAAQWGTRHKVVQFLGSVVGGGGLSVLAWWRLREWPVRFDHSIGDYALLASICVAGFGLTVAGVARQRRGDAREAIPRAAGWGGFSDWSASLFRLPCPTSSATLAQVWFELRSSGLAVLTIGGALAIAIPLLFVVTTRLDVALSGFFTEPATRLVAVVVAVFSLPAVVLLGGNAFGIRTRQGHRYASVFAATQAYGTARMAGLKVLVRSACLLVALAAVVASVWTSASVIPFDVLGDNDTFIEKSRAPLSGWMRGIEGAVVAMSAYQQLALAFVTAIVVAVMVAARAAFTALRARYPRHVNIAGSLLLLHVFVLVLFGLAFQRGIASQSVFYSAQDVTNWVIAVVGAASVLATAYLFWIVLAERLLTLRHVCGALLVSAAFVAAWVTVLGRPGLPLSTMPATDVVWMLTPALSVGLLPLTASVLAPWSLSRIRHT